jgi:hypothetical protein
VTRTVDVVLPIISRSPAHGGISSLLTSSPRTRRARRRIPPRQDLHSNFVTVRAFRAIDPASGTVASRATKIAASVRYASEFPGTCRARTGDLRSAAHQGVGCFEQTTTRSRLRHGACGRTCSTRSRAQLRSDVASCRPRSRRELNPRRMQRFGREPGSLRLHCEATLRHPVRHWLTELGVLTAHVSAFFIVPLYGLAWLLLAPAVI